LKKLPLETFKIKLKEFLLNRYFETWIFIITVYINTSLIHMHARNLFLLKFILLRYI
jgi:hypothetical protein